MDTKNTIDLKNPLKGKLHFVKDPDDKYKCVQCKNVLRPPVKQTLCGHRMCGGCVPGLFLENDTPTCPGNDECVELKINEIHPDIATTKELNRMQVYCSFKENGCSAVTKLTDISEHEKNCDYATGTCHNPGCDVIVLRSHLKRHEQHECEYLPVRCEKCDEFVPKNELHKEHMRSCSPKPKKCIYSELGCEFEGTPDELNAHRKTYNEQHVQDIVRITTKTRSDSEFLKTKMEEITAKLSELQVHIETFKSGTQDSKKVQSAQKSIAKIGEDVINIKEGLENKADQSKLVEYSAKLNEIQNVTKTHESRIAYLEQGSGGGASNGQMTESFRRMESTVDTYNIRFAEYDVRFRLLETAGYDGKMIWKITNYQRRKKDALDGRTLSLYSQPFYTSPYGYKMCARVYLNGDGMGRNTHLSLFFVVMQGEYDALLQWPFRLKVTLAVMDQSGNRKHIKDTFRPDPTSTSFRRPVNEMNIASGSPLFAAQSTVENESYVKDDTMFIRVSVDLSDFADSFP